MRDNRIQATWLLGLTVLLSGVQSYVDATCPISTPSRRRCASHRR
jgi:hypothetical protein